MVRLFILLLIIFLGGFFGLDIITQLLGGSQIEVMGARVANLEDPTFRAVMGLGVAFCQFAIILFSMIDRMFDTLREVIKPLARLVPLVAFAAAAYRTFWPLIQSFLPQEIVGASGNNPNYAIQAVQDGSLINGVLITLGLMLIYLMANRALGSESAEIRALRSELAKYRRVMR